MEVEILKLLSRYFFFDDIFIGIFIVKLCFFGVIFDKELNIVCSLFVFIFGVEKFMEDIVVFGEYFLNLLL